MEEQTYRVWDVALKVAGGIGLVIGAYISFQEYDSTWHQQSTFETNKFEADEGKSLLDKQTDLYFEATRLAARIAVETNRTLRSKELAQWEELYYGPMVIVEDRETGKDKIVPEDGEGKYAQNRNVEIQMIAFHRCSLIEKCFNDGHLQEISLRLADACRLSLSFRVEKKLAMLKSQLSENDLNEKLRSLARPRQVGKASP